MKIKTKRVSYEPAMASPPMPHRKPWRPSFLLSSLVRVLSEAELRAVHFTYTQSRMEEAGKGPYLILMNHSSFIDLRIASRIFYPKPYSIVCTSDGFIGKDLLMRLLGCISTQKFVTDYNLIADMQYMLNKKHTSVLMYPEASYTFDGCATPLPRKFGLLVKRLGVPVVMVKTQGVFLRNPLYNGLQDRKANVSAHVTCLLTQQEVKERTAAELDAVIDGAFTFDNFADQYANKVKVDEPFRADHLHRILYRCAHCSTEGQMVGKGTTLTCGHCGKVYEMTEYGRLQALEGETEFPHIPDWYNWERQCVRQQLEEGTYKLDADVDIGIMADHKAIYMVGEGRLVHDATGFTLTGCDGKLRYTQDPRSSYGLYADYYWYEIGDVICIGNKERLYYCFPKGGDAVAKTRLAAEELYKIAVEKRKLKQQK